MLVSFPIVLAVASRATAQCWRNTTCTGPAEPSFPGPWDEYNYAPASRFVRPKSILSLPEGGFLAEYSNSSISLSTADEGLVFDFGIEVGGIVTVEYSASESVTSGLAFTEAKDFIGRTSDNSNGGTGADGALSISLRKGEGSYTMPDAKLRGGFRYLTLFITSPTNSTSESTLEIKDITLELSFQPTYPNFRAYTGFFSSSYDLLNKIWYAGAYTLQTNSVPPTTGRASISSSTGWNNNALCGPGETVLLDGAKRDRWVWIGDMGTAVPSASVSTGDLESTYNALMAIWDNQRPDGGLPKAGPPYLSSDSDTYHLWTLIGTYNYFLFTEDYDFLLGVWPKYLQALDFSLNKISSLGIMNATQTADWGRWNYGTLASSVNMLLYRSLITGAFLAPYANHPDQATNYTSLASTLKTAILTHLYDPIKGAFKDSPDNITLYPQDANAMALAYSIFEPGSTNATQISDYLVSLWTPIGPQVPELPGNISPFISSIELEGHFVARYPERSLQLIENLWGWYINNPNGTESTVPEGFLIDGSWGYRGDRGYRNDPSYVSHAHGWSSGPTSTLTEYAVGLKITKPKGKEWSLKPGTFEFDGLSEAEAGFETGLGKFRAGFKTRGREVEVTWDTPRATRGWVQLPGEKGGRWVNGGKGGVTVKL